MGLSSDTVTTFNADGSKTVEPAPRYRHARLSATSYGVVDTRQRGSRALPDGLLVWAGEPVERGDVEAQRLAKAEAIEHAGTLNASNAREA